MLRRRGFSLVELLVVIAIIGLLLGLTAAAVQRVRAAADTVRCRNNLKQIGLALHQYHDSQAHLPTGMSYRDGKDPYLYLAWSARILPYLERGDLWAATERAYRVEKDFHLVPHPLDEHLPGFVCPADPRSSAAANFNGVGRNIGLLTYLGNEGVDQYRRDGVLFIDSAVRFADVTDGASNTLLAGERPPSQDSHLGWWYAGTGQYREGSGDSVLGVRELFRALYHVGCDLGPHHFKPGTLTEECDYLHFWSLHPGGAHFLFCDGGVRFLTYSADAILPALATRAGGETTATLD